MVAGWYSIYIYARKSPRKNKKVLGVYAKLENICISGT